MSERASGLDAGIQFAWWGAVVNVALALVKGVAGVLGHSQALVADAVESVGDIAGSMVVWSALRLSAQSADENHPYGHGKAEPLSAASVGLLLCGAAITVAYHAIAAIREKHPPPQSFTLGVLVVVILVKELFFRSMSRAARESGSAAIVADAWHHRADAITSLAAFVGISVALIGGPAWAWADGAAAIVAACLIGLNGWKILSPAIHELMDGAPDRKLIDRCVEAARSVAGVRLIEQIKARKVGTKYLLDMHVQADPLLSLHDAHILGGKVKGTVKQAVPSVENVLVHMEPYEGDAS